MCAFVNTCGMHI